MIAVFDAYEFLRQFKPGDDVPGNEEHEQRSGRVHRVSTFPGGNRDIR